MEITRHARPPTVPTTAKDKVVWLTPRRQHNVAASRRASRAGEVVGNVSRRASGNVAARLDIHGKANIGRRVLAFPPEHEAAHWQHRFPGRDEKTLCTVG